MSHPRNKTGRRGFVPAFVPDLDDARVRGRAVGYWIQLAPDAACRSDAGYNGTRHWTEIARRYRPTQAGRDALQAPCQESHGGSGAPA